MDNYITKKDKGRIRDALTRAFSRSDLRKSVVDRAIVQHSDPTRPKVKNWAQCQVCKKFDAKSYIDCDHIDPKIPIDRSFEELSVTELVDRIFCSPDNLQAICESCHNDKTNGEKAARALYRSMSKPKTERKKKR